MSIGFSRLDNILNYLIRIGNPIKIDILDFLGN